MKNTSPRFASLFSFLFATALAGLLAGCGGDSDSSSGGSGGSGGGGGSDLAPASLAVGSVITITGDSNGTATITAGNTADIVVPGEGTFTAPITYTKTNANTATFRVDQSEAGAGFFTRFLFTFTSATGGTYTANGLDEDGVWDGDAGPFTLTTP